MASDQARAHLSVTRIMARERSTLSSQLSEIWRYRDLFFFLVLRDIRVRYSQTVLGLGWSVLQPFLQMVVFSVFFGTLAGIGSGDIPYPVFSLAGVVPWIYFLNATTIGSASLIANAQVVTKIYFPRLFIPLATVGAGLVDHAIALVLLFAVMGVYGIAPPFPEVVLLPALVALLVLATSAVCILLSALGARYRDVRFVTPFVLQTLLFVTPIIYVVSEVPESLRPFYSLNPLVGVVSGFRAVLLDQGAVPWGSLAISLTVSLVLLGLGLRYFRRVERAFADIA
ncbi:MAG TPA: ABC transporter permease [Gaiellaceae bacterium]|nr:ABC transporter permease [Gaiellaceae bacterium]